METTNVQNDSLTPRSGDGVIPSKNETVSGAQRVCFDDQGDLTLLIGSGKAQQPFIVCSRTLSRASPVFRGMLYGGFRESKPAAGNDANEPWVVELPEDMADSAETVLSIVHSQFARVPAALSLGELWNVLVFTEKYDMTALIQPWVQTWKLHCDWHKISRHYIATIGVSWELGLENTLDSVGDTLVAECTVDEEGRLVHWDWEDTKIEYDLPLIPPGFLENVADARRALIRLIFNLLSTVISDLQGLVKAGGSRKFQYCAMEQPHCHAMSLGSIMSELGNAELAMLWGMEETKPEFAYKFSVKHLLGILKKMASRATYNIQYGLRQQGHDFKCDPAAWLDSQIATFLASRKSVLTKQHISRMEAQRAKLGVEWGKLGEARVLFEPPDAEGDGESAWW